MNISPIGLNCQNYVRNAFVSKNSVNFAGNPINNFTGNFKTAAIDTVSFKGNLYSYNEPAIETIKTIKARGGAVPKRVEELAKQFAQDEKLKDANLYAVHRSAYKALNDCKTLEEAKELYSEFSNVKNAGEVKSSFGSALEYLKSGCIEWFDEGCDVSLNILKYYWYDLNSLQDFHWFAQHKYTKGRFDYQSTFIKLEIPKFDRQYAQAMRAFK